MKALLFGTGAIGGGVVLPMAQATGIECTVVARNPERRKQLEENPILRIHRVNSEIHNTEVIKLNHIIDETDAKELRRCITDPQFGCIFTAVGGQNLAQVAKATAPFLIERHRMQIPLLGVFPYENVPLSGNKFTSLVENHAFGSCQAIKPSSVVVDCMAFRDEYGEIVRESYEETQICALNGDDHPLTKTQKVTIVDGIFDYYRRKIALVSAIHTAVAWLGLQAGIERTNQAAFDPRLEDVLFAVINEMAQAVDISTNGRFSVAELTLYGCQTVERVGNPYLPDHCSKFTRSLPEKLSVQGRFGEPAINFFNHFSKIPYYICQMIGLGLWLGDKMPDVREQCYKAVSQFPEELLVAIYESCTKAELVVER